MTFNMLLTGVGGEGVLFSSVIIVRAANLEGHKVSGTQLHGLAQRGGMIPTHVRFGGEAFSPTIPKGEADLILGLEPVEAVRVCGFADRKRANFVVDNYPIIPVYTNILKERYPSLDEVRKMIAPFARKAVFVDASNICSEKLGDPVYGNVMAIGVAVSQGLLPLGERSLEKAIKQTAGKHAEKDLQAFLLGLEWKG